MTVGKEVPPTVKKLAPHPAIKIEGNANNNKAYHALSPEALYNIAMHTINIYIQQ